MGFDGGGRRDVIDGTSYMHWMRNEKVPADDLAAVDGFHSVTEEDDWKCGQYFAERLRNRRTVSRYKLDNKQKSIKTFKLIAFLYSNQMCRWTRLYFLL